MYIEKIQSPADLKGLSLAELKTVADETRAAVLNRVVSTAVTWVPTSDSLRPPWHCTMCLMRQRINSCST